MTDIFELPEIITNFFRYEKVKSVHFFVVYCITTCVYVIGYFVSIYFWLPKSVSYILIYMCAYFF